MAQGNFSHISKSLRCEVLEILSSGDCHNFLTNKDRIDEIIRTKVVHRETKNIDEYLDEVFENRPDSIAYQFNGFSDKQVKRIFLAEDIDENIAETLKHIDKNKIYILTASSRYRTYCGGKQKMLTELNYAQYED